MELVALLLDGLIAFFAGTLVGIGVVLSLEPNNDRFLEILRDLYHGAIVRWFQPL